MVTEFLKTNGVRALSGIVVIYLALFLLGLGTYPDNATGQQQSVPEPVQQHHEDIVQSGGLDPVGLMLARERIERRQMADRLEKLELLCALQVRQIRQLQNRVFNIGAIGAKPIGGVAPGTNSAPTEEDDSGVILTPAELVPGDSFDFKPTPIGQSVLERSGDED